MNNEAFNKLNDSEMMSINGGDSVFSTIGHVIGKGLAYAAHGLSCTSTATQVRWVHENAEGGGAD